MWRPGGVAPQGARHAFREPLVRPHALHSWIRTLAAGTQAANGSAKPSTFAYMATRSMWLTRANGVTFLRLFMAPLIVIAIAAEEWGAATTIFAVAVMSDIVDGYLARSYGESTPIGGAMDHTVDAVFVTAGTGALAAAGSRPVPLPPLIAVAFLQYAIDSRVGPARPLRASSIGRWNGIAYYVVLAVPVVRDALGLAWPGTEFVMLAGWALVLSTGVSILDRLYATLRNST